MNKIFKKIRRIEEGNWWYVSRLELVNQIVKEFNKKKLKILDVGCGTGSVMESFSKEYDVIGVDSMEQAVRYTSKRGIKVRKGNAKNLPFKKNSFDVVLCLDILEHIKNDGKVVEEVYKVLKEGGKFIITVSAFNLLWGEADDLSFHVRRYAKNTILKLLRDFKIKKCTYWNTTLFFPVLISRTIGRLTKHLKKPNKPSLYNLVYTEELSVAKPLNNILTAILRFENTIIKKTNLPFGISLVVVCEK